MLCLIDYYSFNPCKHLPKDQYREKCLVDLQEQERQEALFHFERQAKERGFSLIAGIDEAGRGPLAGPVVAAACILPSNTSLSGINDSKLLSAKQRAQLFDALLKTPGLHYGVGVVSPQEIDTINIYQATIVAMLQAVANLSLQPDYLLVDGMALCHPTIPSEKIIKGDQLSLSIAAASIIAKETRDRMMEEYDTLYPQYGFKKHKGYGTALHMSALQEHGPCEIHRRSFAPVKELIHL